MRTFINKYFSFILLIAGLVGFILPSPGEWASYILLTMLFLVIFVSCFQIDLKAHDFRLQSGNAVFFTILRFIVIPLLVFFIIKPFSGFYAFTLMFLLILPSAVASPAVTAMFTKNVNLSLMILVFNSLVATMVIPVYVPWLSGGIASVDPKVLFYTIALTVVLPFFLHLPLRKFQKINKWIINNLPYIIVVCLSILLMVAISKTKQTVFEQPDKVLIYGLIALLFYSGSFAIGWFIMPVRSISNKITFSISSGMNNIGLGISLATIYLPPKVAVFCIMAEFAWIIVLIPVRIILGNIIKKNSNN